MNNHKRHMCNVCEKWGEWGTSWAWYGSYRNMENSGRIIKTCSDKCKADAKAKLVKNRGVF